MCAISTSSNPCACSRSSMPRTTRSCGIRRSAPIIGGPNFSRGTVKELDLFCGAIYSQSTLPPGEGTMTTSTHEAILVGGMAIRPRIEPGDSDGALAIHEFDVPAGGRLPVAHSHDAYEETI